MATITTQQNTELARKYGLIGANESAGSGLVAIRIKSASPSVVAAYEAERSQIQGTTYKAPVTPINWNDTVRLTGQRLTPTQQAQNEAFYTQALDAQKKHGSITPERAAILQKEIAIYDEVLANYAGYDPSIGRDRMYFDPNAPLEVKRAGAARAIAYNELVGDKNNTWDAIKGIAATAGAFIGGTFILGTGASATTTGLTAASGVSNAANVVKAGTVAVGGAVSSGVATVGAGAAAVGNAITSAAPVVSAGVSGITALTADIASIGAGVSAYLNTLTTNVKSTLDNFSNTIKTFENKDKEKEIENAVVPSGTNMVFVLGVAAVSVIAITLAIRGGK